MKNFVFTCFLLCLVSVKILAQIPETGNASDIFLQMKKLKVLGSVLYIAAHPDDENTRLLAWLSKDKLYRTGYLSLTRGDGGQNLIGDEQGIELGLLRTQELLAARRIDGAEQFFSRAYDFGFSKTTSEALRIWDEQKILSDVVWVIRKFQPDVIITRFPEDKRAGHGQHSASSVLARMAFSAAADPKQFPGQLKYGVKPWQARRLFWNNYNFGSVNTTREDQLKIEVGGFNPLVGKSYGEIAADSRSQHRSQGFGVPHTRGNSYEYFSLTAGDSADSSLLQHINDSWSRIPGGDLIEQKISGMLKNFDASAPALSLPALVDLYRNIRAMPEGYWRNVKLEEVVRLVQSCSGLYLEATTTEAYVLRSQTIPVTCQVTNRSAAPMSLLSVSLNQQDTSCNLPLKTGVNYSVTRKISIRNLPISQPYWLLEPMSTGSYNVQDQTLVGKPQNPPGLEAVFTIGLSGETFVFKENVFYKNTDAVKGERFEPVTIVPDQMAYCEPALLVFDKSDPKELLVRAQSKTSEPVENSIIHAAGGLKTNAFRGDFSLTPVPGFDIPAYSASGNAEDFSLRRNNTKDQNAFTWVTHSVDRPGDTLRQCISISYDHIPRIDYFKAAGATIVSVNLKTAGSRIGYIEGAGDKVPDALTAMGYTVVRLNEHTLNADEIRNLDAVITGVRAYDVHDWLFSKYEVLMNYIKNGGNLIVQYNRNLGTDTTGIGPYPFGISNSRITEEDAPVQFLLPGHPVLHFPNEIGSADFDGWIQERGIYFAAHADPRYQAIFSMHDSGEPDLNGSLITGSYGRGNFTYTGLVFFRELPAGVPGAYRLLANIIALNQPKDR